jgi:glyoxylase-like metal-dependent hydrolase (beta-lactamase superfamily II)
MIKIDSFINDINNSNCYVIQDQECRKCIAIDPGGRNITSILEFLDHNNLNLDYIILTHSHFDHIAGVGALVSNKKSIIIASELCSSKIVDPIKNLSFFSEIDPIISPKADIFIENMVSGELNWNNNTIKCFLTPGHSLCSICIQIENYLFAGDTLIKGSGTKITQPDGNRQELKHTLMKIYDCMPEDMTVFPGHGESFILGIQDISISLNK